MPGGSDCDCPPAMHEHKYMRVFLFTLIVCDGWFIIVYREAILIKYVFSQSQQMSGASDGADYGFDIRDEVNHHLLLP